MGCAHDVGDTWDIDPVHLGGDPRRPSNLVLRRVIAAYVVDRRRPVTVAELVEWLRADGFALDGRPSKVVSDKLRADVSRGRLRRVGRGRYVEGTIATTTRRRILHTGARAVRMARAAAALSAGEGSAPCNCDRVGDGSIAAALSAGEGSAPCNCDRAWSPPDGEGWGHGAR